MSKVNLVLVDFDPRHKKFTEVALECQEMGFHLYCRHKWTSEITDFIPRKNVLILPDPDIVYTGTINRFENDLIKFVVDNSFMHGGCIKHFAINASAE